MAKIPDIFPDPAFDPAETGAPQGSVVLGGGCFWCVEGVFRHMPGVVDVVSGYAGGAAADANYRAVCTGRTGHVEVVVIRYDPAQTSLGRVLKTFFWLAHDPTQENGQGHDIGPQYRSVIFYADDTQRMVAERYIAQLDAEGVFAAPIATRVEKLDRFYRAEDEHQDYAALNPAQSYIAAVANPKIEKTRKAFSGS